MRRAPGQVRLREVMAGYRMRSDVPPRARAQANPVPADSLSGARSPELLAPRGWQGRGANGAPRGEVWEQSFSMSPEVRFTRTPERVLKERRMKGVSQPSYDAVEDRAREIAATRMEDPHLPFRSGCRRFAARRLRRRPAPAVPASSTGLLLRSGRRSRGPGSGSSDGGCPRSRNIAEPAAPQRKANNRRNL